MATFAIYCCLSSSDVLTQLYAPSFYFSQWWQIGCLWSSSIHSYCSPKLLSPTWGRISQFSLLLSQRKMTRLICMAISYVNGILLTLSFIPTPILILLCFKPVSEQLGKLPIWLYSCCHCKQEPTAADHTSLFQNCYSLITHFVTVSNVSLYNVISRL